MARHCYKLMANERVGPINRRYVNKVGYSFFSSRFTISSWLNRDSRELCEKGLK